MADAPAWTSLFLGLFLVAAALGELRRPGMWHGMIEEIEASSALQMIAGVAELALGILVYLANRGSSVDDWLALLMLLLGGLMIAEAFVVMAFSDLYVRFWMRRIGTRTRGWALFILLLGAAFGLAGLLRFF